MGLGRLGRAPLAGRRARLLVGLGAGRSHGRAAALRRRARPLTRQPGCLPGAAAACAGGELLDAMEHQGSYTEGDARAIFRQIADGLAYLHSK